MRFFRKSWKYQVTTVIKYLFLILVAIVIVISVYMGADFFF